MSEYPPTVGGIHAWVATAPQPRLAITGHTGVISDVRYVWCHARCIRCRTVAHLWTDGGSIEAGLTTGSPSDTRWYTNYRPAAAPRIPDQCPNPACTGAGIRWLDHPETLTDQPFALRAATPPHYPHPVGQAVLELLDQLWTALRTAYPELVAAADRRPPRA
ncbi:hypothetical protein OHA21_00130 [Actinoplanes sp. NBC_00393]|uniref:hypothetical protein n=1 Tax=Actinoplanes sp. NBC_00393 TaxID=2975953 RepID=UPI002E220030